MECHFTLPAESYSVANGISPRGNQSNRQLAGNNLWAVGHLADSTNHNLFYFDGIKGGKCVWHKFQTPNAVAEEVQLELAWEGGLAMRMDKMLFLGTVQSVLESRISWTSVSNICRDFQIGRDYVCHRSFASDNFLISRCDAPEDFKDVSPPSSVISCYCMTSRDDVITLSGCDVLILKSPHNDWLRISTSVPRSFPYFSAPKLPQFSTLLVTSGSLRGVSADTESMYVLPLVQSPSWSSSRLDLQVRDICAMSGTSLSFLIIDNHFVLHTAVSDSGSLRRNELSHSILPDKEVLFTSVRSIRSLFDKIDDLSSLCQSSVTAPSSEMFFTAGPPEDQPMDMEPTDPPTPVDFLSQSIEFPFLSSPKEETFLSPTPESVDQSEIIIFSSAPIDTSSQSPPFDWSSVNPEEINEPTIGKKRTNSPNEESPHKYSRYDVTLPSFDLIGRTSEERRIDKRYLRENRTPCPLSDCSFIPSWRDFSYFEGIAATRTGSPSLMEQTQTILGEQPFEFSEVREEVINLSRIYPDTPGGSHSPPPPSAPCTQEFLL